MGGKQHKYKVGDIITVKIAAVQEKNGKQVYRLSGIENVAITEKTLDKMRQDRFRPDSMCHVGMTGYIEAKRRAEEAVKNNEDAYIPVRKNARIHVYMKKEAGNNMWYYADCEILNGNLFEVRSTMSGATLEELSSIIGISWNQLNRQK